MDMMSDKKGFIYDWGEVIKGFLIGIVFGIVLMALIVYEVIPFPFSFC